MCRNSLGEARSSQEFRMDVEVTVILTFDSHQILIRLSLGPGLHVCYIWEFLSLSTKLMRVHSDLDLLTSEHQNRITLFQSPNGGSLCPLPPRRFYNTQDWLIIWFVIKPHQETRLLTGSTGLGDTNEMEILHWATWQRSIWSGLIYRGRRGMKDSMCSSVMSFVPDSIWAKLKDMVCYGVGHSAEWRQKQSLLQRYWGRSAPWGSQLKSYISQSTHKPTTTQTALNTVLQYIRFIVQWLRLGRLLRLHSIHSDKRSKENQDPYVAPGGSNRQKC